MDLVADLKWRKAVRDSVVGCKKCTLFNSCTAPVPFAGKKSPTLVCVGEAPGKQEDQAGQPFIGPAGKLLRKWLGEAGFNERDVSFVNVVSCYPGRTPTGREVEACRSNLAAQLAYLNCKWLLVLGGVALNALLSPGVGRITDLRGLWFRPDGVGEGTVALATWHPAAVLRNRELELKAVEDLLYMRLVIEAGESPFITNSEANGLCWAKGCYNDIAGDYKGIYFCHWHPIKIEGEKDGNQKRFLRLRERMGMGMEKKYYVYLCDECGKERVSNKEELVTPSCCGWSMVWMGIRRG